MLVIKQLTVAIDFHCTLLWKSMATNNCLTTNIL